MEIRDDHSAFIGLVRRKLQGRVVVELQRLSRSQRDGAQDRRTLRTQVSRKELFGSRIIDLENLSQDVKRVSRAQHNM